MESSKKRKRDSECPRISYHTSTRTFDRLFREDSLAQMKDVVKRKLGLHPEDAIILSQLREGQSIDLEDDDDFDAFYALAHSTDSVNVQVAVVERQDALMTSRPQTPSKKRKRKNTQAAAKSQSTSTEHEQPVEGERVPDVPPPILPGSTTEPPKKKQKKSVDSAEKVAVPAASTSKPLVDSRSDTSKEKKKKAQNSNKDNVAPTILAPEPSVDATSEPSTMKKKKIAANATLATGQDIFLPTSNSSNDVTTDGPKKKKNKQSKDMSLALGPAPAIPLPVDTAPAEAQKPKKRNKKSKQTAQTMEDETKATSSTPHDTGKAKNNTLPGDEVVAPASALDVSAEPQNTLTEQTKPVKENRAKRRKSKKDMVEVNSEQTNQNAHISQTESSPSAQPIPPEVENESLSTVTKDGHKGPSAKVKKPKKERKELVMSPDRRKAYDADMDAIFAKAIAKRTGVAASANSSSAPGGDVASSFKLQKNVGCSEPLGPDSSPIGVGTEQPSRADLHGSLLTLRPNQAKPTVESPLVENTKKTDTHLKKGHHDCPPVISVNTETARKVSSVNNNAPSTPSISRSKRPSQAYNARDTSSDEASNHKSSVPDNAFLSISAHASRLEDINLDDIIQGPVSGSVAARIANLESSDEEDDNEETPVLEEDEPEVPRRSRKSLGVSAPDSSDDDDDDSGFEDTRSVDNSHASTIAQQDEVTASSGADHVSFQAVDRIGESQEIDRSADAAFNAALDQDTAILNFATASQAKSSDPVEASRNPSSAGSPISEPIIMPDTEITPLVSTPAPVLPIGPSTPQFLPPTTSAESLAGTKSVVSRMKPRSARGLLSEKKMDTPTMSRDNQEGTARRTRAASRREALDTITPPASPKMGTQSRVIFASGSNRIEDGNLLSPTSRKAMELDTWAALEPSSPVLDTDVTMMVDELEPSSPNGRMDVGHSNENDDVEDVPGEDPLFLASESLPAFPYSQWNNESQNVRDQNEVNGEEETGVEKTRKTTKSQRYRRLTDITSDHGLFSTPANNLRTTRSSTAAKKAMDMYGRTGKEDEIESGSETDSNDSDAKEVSHIPKSRRAGTTTSRRKK